jgi:integral membrane sensor domain MASE1
MGILVIIIVTLGYGRMNLIISLCLLVSYFLYKIDNSAILHTLFLVNEIIEKIKKDKVCFKAQKNNNIVILPLLVILQIVLIMIIMDKVAIQKNNNNTKNIRNKIHYKN